MIKLSLTDIAKQLSLNTPTQEATFTGLSKDTRSLPPGCLYVAIRGEQFDGHDFVEEALKKGASAALVDHKVDSDIPQLIVKDTLETLGKIATSWRDQFNIPYIGVTGSNGKTTLKNMIASILTAACHNETKHVLATEGNLNNNIGVPFMLARLNKDHRYAVIEMGMNHFNEIAYLTHMVRPQVAIVNNAAEAHLEGLKDVAGVAKAKGEIFQGLAKNGTAILNRDDAHFDYWKGLVKEHAVITFGLDQPADVTASISNQHITIKTPKGDIDVKLPLLGKHNVRNATAATAATLALNIPLSAIKMGLEKMQPAKGRMQQYVLANGARVIDDTYNANPVSLQAAVNTLATFSGKKILVLGDMKELGPDTKQLHFSSGEKIRAAGINQVLTFGELSAATSEAFGENAQHFTERDKLIDALKPLLNKDVTLLVKGSRSMKMEKVLAAIVPEEQLDHAH
jgi:UDP-N-acetylmuramoyl-tripeptide--D-alanyl-D-alanine ligase